MGTSKVNASAGVQTQFFLKLHPKPPLAKVNPAEVVQVLELTFGCCYSCAVARSHTCFCQPAFWGQRLRTDPVLSRAFERIMIITLYKPQAALLQEILLKEIPHRMSSVKARSFAASKGQIDKDLGVLVRS